jgi:aspartyl-tRNA synthetase
MERIYIKDLKEHVGNETTISGWVDGRRDHGKLIFLDIRDVTGKVQAVISAKDAAYVVVNEFRSEWVVSIKGMVNSRPEKMVNPDEENGSVEIYISEATVLGKAKELPFELSTETNIDTHLDHLPLTLRTSKSRAIFKVQAQII